ncbi:GHKL domain-containing protein [Ochrobactrum sp. MR28]|nr:GHKL domain-containing protein [Ochrobactrum sp. MR28]MBX8818350.1 GHKL domain-containing protein [Ochrobactrum sp. MR31]
MSELLRTDLTQRNITLLIQTDKNTPAIMGDAVEMEQVLYNLIRNAADSLVQTEKTDKQISVTAHSGQGQLVITVSDNGSGIGDDVLPRLFEPFFTTRNGGMGLGLALCATLIERIDGEITAANRPEGGAEFTITLPVADASSIKV